MLTAQFVDSIASGAAVRLDLNDGTTWSVLASGTETPPPTLRRALQSNMLVDGSRQVAAAYDPRVVTISANLLPADLDAAATALQVLSRELDRPGNILRWAPGTSEPVYFRTMRGEYATVNWSETARRVTIRCLAEPFAYGEVETGSPVTVNASPAAGSNALHFDVTDVKGDVETPPILRVDLADPIGAGTLASVIGVRRRGTPSSAPFVLQAEAMTTGTDTTLPGNDATMSGASNNYARVSFSTVTALQTRLTYGEYPAAAAVDVRGTYRVFLRCRQNTAGGIMAVRLSVGASGVGGSNVVNDTVTLADQVTNIRWIDLGLVTFPIFGDPITDGYGPELSVGGQSFGIEVQRVSGTGSFDMDCLLFVPADDRYMSIHWPDLGTDVPPYVVMDGPNDIVYLADTGPVVHANNAGIAWVGSLPMLSPGVTNRIVWLINAGEGNQGDALADTVTVRVSYYPRYLHVRPVLT